MDIINKWLTLAANAGVVVGIIFLAIEIRGNTQALRSQEIAQDNAFNREFQLLLATDPILMPVIMKTYYEPSALTFEELHRVTYYLVARADNLRNCFRSYKDGLINEADWDDCRNSAPVYLGGDFSRVWWDYIKSTDYKDDLEFVSEIDEVLDSSNMVTNDQWFLNFQKHVENSNL